MNNLNKVIYLIPILATLVGCGGVFNAPPHFDYNEPLGTYGQFSEDDFLKVTGKRVHTVGDEEKDIFLQGINVGGLFFIEQWMSPVLPNDRVEKWDQKKKQLVTIE